jgi:hypothetical protein
MPAPLLEHAVDAHVPLAFAWRQRTDVRTWHDPPAQFRLPMPFADGAVGKTVVPGEQPVTWTIRDVQHQQAFTVEIALDDAVVAFEWRFEELGPLTTRLTQRVWLSGPNAAAYEESVRGAFGATLGPGMKRVARSLEEVYRSEQAG